MDRLGPDRAGLLGVGAELALEQLDHLEHGDLAGWPGERVAAAHAALALQDPGAAQRGEQPFEELHRDVAAPGDLPDRHRRRTALARQLHEGAQRVWRL